MESSKDFADRSAEQSDRNSSDSISDGRRSRSWMLGLGLGNSHEFSTQLERYFVRHTL